MEYPHSLATDEVLRRIVSDAERGIDDGEAARRRERYGANVLPKPKNDPAWKTFLRQFKSALVLLLIGAATLSATLGEWRDAVVIIAVVAVNATVGFLQERRAEHAIERLKELVVGETTVVREGDMRRIAVSDVVPGDIIVIEAGDRIPADARLLECKDLELSEAQLTGESSPVRKSVEPLPANAPLADRLNMAFMGTSAVSGSGLAVVVETGARTAFGHIAASLREIRREPTPFERRVDGLARGIGIFCIAAAAGILALSFARGATLLESVFIGIAVLVSAIPEGLPAVLIIVLAIGVQRMAARRAIVRHLPAVETLGGADIICTDKTGTITENKMTVREVVTADARVEVEGEGWSPRGKLLRDGREIRASDDPTLMSLVMAAGVVPKARIEWKDGRPGVVGDPTEGALVVFAEKAGLTGMDVARSFDVLDDVPFSSERKYRAVLAQRSVRGDVERFVMMAGAFEVVAARCTHVRTAGGDVPLSDALASRFIDHNAAMADGTQRVIAVAAKSAPGGLEALADADVQGMTLLGIVGMIDPPRKGVGDAIAACQRAGIRVIMATGDHKRTAIAIGREVGLLPPEDDGERSVFTETDVASMSDADFASAARNARIFARVSPETKLRIISTLQGEGHVVAMTGDGVNDAPALKKASIGIAMGVAGTDVTREVADIVLADDDFVTIVSAVEEGRIVYRNVKQTTAYLFMTNMAELATLAVALIIGLPIPLIPVQILWMNLVTDGFSVIALATERSHDNALLARPWPRRAAIISPNVVIMTVLTTVLMAAGTVLLFVYGLRLGGLEYGRTVAFTTMALFQLWNVFNLRSFSRSIFTLGLTTNLWVLAAVFLSFVLQIVAVYAPPLRDTFRLVPLAAKDWLIVLAMTSSIIAVFELYKVLVRRRTIPLRWL